MLILARRSAVDVRRRRARPAPQRDRDCARDACARSCGVLPSPSWSGAAVASAARTLAPPTSSRPSSRSAPSRNASKPPPMRQRSSSARSSATSARSCRELLDEAGVGPIVAAQLIVSWSHKDRVRSEAAFARLAGVAPLPASSGLTDPPPPQPRRRPPTQPRPPHRHPPPPPTRPRHQAIHRPSRRRRQNPPRSHPPTQALPRPPPLPRHAKRDAAHDLTVIGDSLSLRKPLVANCRCGLVLGRARRRRCSRSSRPGRVAASVGDRGEARRGTRGELWGETG